MILLFIIALIVVLAIAGGLAVSKFLFLILIVAAIVALVGFIGRTT